MGISAFTGPFVIKFVIGNSIEKSLFHIVFWIGSIFQFICLILLFFFNEKKFEYIPRVKNPDQIEENRHINSVEI